MDPRLKEFTEAVKKRMEQRRGSVSDEVQKARGEAEEGPRQGETLEMARQRASVQRQKEKEKEKERERERERERQGQGQGARRREVVDDMSSNFWGL